jgi:hypothetical protein
MDPNLVSMFNGVDLTGWTAVDGKPSMPDPASWSIVGGAIHSNAQVRGFLYSNTNYGTFRFIFTERLITTVHAACVLFWGVPPMGTTPLPDADGAIQFQVQGGGGHWDYRPGGGGAGKGFSGNATSFVKTDWNQCEIVANLTTGKARQACCQRTGPGPCKGVENMDFTNTAGPAAPQKAPIALQCHTGGGMMGGSITEFKDLYVDPDQKDDALVTTQ